MLQPGSQIGRYEIQRRLGRGGMGTVYVAHDPVLGRMVAIKVFLSDLDLADAAERFAREARSAAALNHTNIVTIHDFGDVASQPYIVMEYVQGETLAAIIRRKAPVALVDKLRWIEDLCAGVAYAHQIGVIHRDIKPTNLIVDRSGRLKILDFGIAKMLGTLASNATALIGTPGYMAPEQIVGGTIDHRSDLFSIGVVCYELLAYAEAFAGDTVPAITHRILTQEPVSLTQLVADMSPDLVAVVERALKKSAAERFADAESFRTALGRVRRQMEGESGLNAALAATRISGPPGVGTSQRGTGSERKQVNAAVGVAQLTPPPDPRRADREALARRRTTQIEAALELARLSLERNELEQAMDACEQALTLDETHAAAIELEERIKAALAKQRAGAFLRDARDELGKGALTAAQGLLQQARALDPDAPDAKSLELDLRLARVEQERLRQRAEAVNRALAAAKQALERGEVEAALASAREVLQLDPDSTDARAIEADALHRLREATGAGAVTAAVVQPTIAAPARRTPAPTPTPTPTPKTKRRPAIVAKSPRRDLLAAVRPLVASVQAAAKATTKKAQATTRKQRLIIGSTTLAAVVVIVALAGVIPPIRPSPVLTGTLIVDAVPWATITAIKAEDGTTRPLPSPASTPLLLQVPVGNYEIRLVGPPPDSESRLIRVQVQDSAVRATPVERFKTLTAEEYFEDLKSPTASSETATPPPDVASPPPLTPSQSPVPPGVIP